MRILLSSITLIIFNSCTEAIDNFIEKENEVGVFEEYIPSDTSVNFHKVHAKELEIDCKKCHFENSKNGETNLVDKDICLTRKISFAEYFVVHQFSYD